MKVTSYTRHLSDADKKVFATSVIANLLTVDRVCVPCLEVTDASDLARVLRQYDSRNFIAFVHLHTNYVEIISNPPMLFAFPMVIIDHTELELQHMERDYF